MAKKTAEKPTNAVEESYDGCYGEVVTHESLGKFLDFNFKMNLKAEQAGKDSFTSGNITSYLKAENYARMAYNTAIERDCFVAGWNVSYWDEQSRVLKGNK